MYLKLGDTLNTLLQERLRIARIKFFKRYRGWNLGIL